MVVPDEHDEERRRSEHNPQYLFGKKRQSRPALIMSHAVNGEHPDRQDGKDKSEKPQVEAVQSAAVHHPIDHGAPALACCACVAAAGCVKGLAAVTLI